MNWFNSLKINKNPKGFLQEAEVARAEQELKILDQGFKDALKFLRAESKQGAERRPFYLVIGHSQFGKTTLLANSGLKLHDVYGNTISATLATKYCSWWFSDDAVYLDTAGVYAKLDKYDPHYNLVWMGFIKLLQKYLYQYPLAGILVVVDVPTLVGDQILLRTILGDMRERVYDIAKYLEELPIYVVCTKADLIPGFTTFFADVDEKERAKTFGITFTVGDTPTQQVHTFHNQYDKLVKEQQDKILSLLPVTAEQDDFARITSIIEFPLQLNNLRQRVVEILNLIPCGAHIQLHGIYFTSSIQHGTTYDLLTQKLATKYDLDCAALGHAQALSLSSCITPRTYFVAQLLQTIAKAPEGEKKPNLWQINLPEIPWRNFGLILFGLFVVFSAAFFLGSAYNKNAAALHAIHAELQKYNAEPSTEAFYDVIEKTSSLRRTWWANIGFSQVKSIDDFLHKRYYKMLAPTFIAELQETLESALTIESTAGRAQLPATLNVYRMLGGQTKLIQSDVINWFAKYWQKLWPKDVNKQREMITELNFALQRGVHLTLNPEIIATAKSQSTTPSGNLPIASIYTMLEQKYAEKKLVFKISDQTVIVSKLYTADNFNKVFYQDIREILQEVVKQQGAGNVDSLVFDLRSLYLQKYAKAWDDAAKTIVIKPIPDVATASRILNASAYDDTSLVGFISAFIKNTNFEGAPLEFRENVADKFVDLRKFNDKAFMPIVLGLANYLNYLTKSGDISKAAFGAAVSRMQNDNSANDVFGELRQFAERAPQPVQTWLRSFAAYSWQAVLNDAKAYINSAWMSSVYPQYQKAIDNHYPFFKEATQSVALDDFGNFFGSHGGLTNFFNTFLKPFVDTSQAYWVWKNVDGERLDIPQSSLDVFIRGTLIQSMFYADGGQNLGVKFKLMQLGLSPNTRDVTLKLGDQIIASSSGARKTESFAWPMSGSNVAELNFVNARGASFNTKVENDPWAWFRLLDKANLQEQKDQQHFELLFDLNGSSVRYALIADTAANPFIPNILTEFRCPNRL